MRTVTKAMAIHFIDGKCLIKKWKSLKTTLSDYTCVLLDLLLMLSEWTHIHTHTYQHENKNDFKKPSKHG